MQLCVFTFLSCLIFVLRYNNDVIIIIIDALKRLSLF